MSLYLQYLLFSISLVVDPELPISPRPTIVSQPLDGGQLMVILGIITYFSGTCCLLQVDAIIHKTVKLS